MWTLRDIGLIWTQVSLSLNGIRWDSGLMPTVWDFNCIVDTWVELDSGNLVWSGLWGYVWTGICRLRGWCGSCWFLISMGLYVVLVWCGLCEGLIWNGPCKMLIWIVLYVVLFDVDYVCYWFELHSVGSSFGVWISSVAGLSRIMLTCRSPSHTFSSYQLFLINHSTRWGTQRNRKRSRKTKTGRLVQIEQFFSMLNDPEKLRICNNSEKEL